MIVPSIDVPLASLLIAPMFPSRQPRDPYDWAHDALLTDRAASPLPLRYELILLQHQCNLLMCRLEQLWNSACPSGSVLPFSFCLLAVTNIRNLPVRLALLRSWLLHEIPTFASLGC